MKNNGKKSNSAEWKKYCDFNNIRNLAIKHYREFKEVMNDIEKVNVNTHKWYQNLAKLKQKNKNTSISLVVNKSIHF